MGLGFVRVDVRLIVEGKARILAKTWDLIAQHSAYNRLVDAVSGAGGDSQLGYATNRFGMWLTPIVAKSG